MGHRRLGRRPEFIACTELGRSEGRCPEFTACTELGRSEGRYPEFIEGTALLIIVASMLAGCARAPFTAATPTPVAVAPEADVATGPRSGTHPVVASGEIVPAHEAHPGFAVSGRVAALAVAEGDVVEAGQTLVMLETDLLEADVARAEAAFAVAQAKLARLKAGPRAGEIAAAQARVEAAEGTLEEVAARRDQLTAGAREAKAAAQAQLAAADADWMAARIAYDQLHDRAQADDWRKEEALLRRQAAELSRIAAQAEVAQAEARSAVEVRAARAVLSTTVAQQDVAQARLDLLQAGPTAEEITTAEATVRQAEAALEAARIALEQALLRAPCDGTVTALEVETGETVMPGQVVLTLAHLRRLQAETTDLSERDVGRVAVGQPATVYVEPLDVQISGRVVDIAPRADILGGDVVYGVTIALDEQPPGLRWGMSVEVEIAVQ